MAIKLVEALRSTSLLSLLLLFLRAMQETVKLQNEIAMLSILEIGTSVGL